MSNEIELYSKLQNPIEAIDRMGEFFSKSGLFGCDRIEQGKVLALVCMVERKSPVAIMRDYDIVEGKLRKKALAALADFRGKGGKHKWLRSGDESADKEENCAAELWLRDAEGIELTYRYSMADARKEGLIKPKSRWEKRPGNMLRARCISNALGMLCPELYAGDDDADAPEQTPAEPLLPPKQKQEPKPANVIDIPATETKVETKQQAPEPPANTQQPESEVKNDQAAAAAPGGQTAQAPKFGPADVRTGPDGRITVETIKGLMQAIGEHHAGAALKWLQEKKWITQNLSDLNVERARRILEKPEVFVGYVTAAKPEAAK